MRITETFYQLSLEIYNHIINLVPVTWVHYDQIIRASASIPANIAEGLGRRRDTAPNTKIGYYQQFILMARGSLFETVAWLDIGWIDKTLPDISSISKQLDKLNQLLEEELKQKPAKED